MIVETIIVKSRVTKLEIVAHYSEGYSIVRDSICVNVFNKSINRK